MMHKKTPIILVGMGRLGSALLNALLHSQCYIVHVVDPTLTKTRSDHDNLLCYTTQNDLPLDLNPKVVIFCIKPQIAASIIPLYNSFTSNSLFISVMAGFSLESLYTNTNGKGVWVRVMPNLAARVRESATTVVRSKNLTESDIKTITEIVSTFGLIYWTDDEAQLDLITILSSSSPALFYQLCQFLYDIGIQKGLDPILVTDLITQTLKGSARLLELSDKGSTTPSTLIHEIASPNGVTHAMLSHLKEANFEELIASCVDVGEKRCNQLSV